MSIASKLADLAVPADLIAPVRAAIMRGCRAHETGNARDIYRDEEGAIVARYRFAGGYREVVVL